MPHNPWSMDMKKTLAKSRISEFLVGLVFGLGLIVSGMTDPGKVLGFLDLAGLWDPSLAFVMGGAIAVGLFAFALAKKRTTSFLGGAMHLPTSRDIDRSGVTRAGDGTLNGVSTQSRAGASVDDLAKPFKNNQVGVTTAGDIRHAGGRVTADGHPGNPNHATVDGLTEHQLERLFSPTRPNPVPPAQRGF